MTSTKLTVVAVGLVALLVVAGSAAALPTQAVDNAQSDQPRSASDRTNGGDSGSKYGPDTTPTNSNASTPPEQANDRSTTGSSQAEDPDRGAGASGDARGPPADMPDHVPDHVTQIHETIRSFLNGDLTGSLGEAISGLLGSEGGSQADDSPESGQANAQPS